MKNNYLQKTSYIGIAFFITLVILAGIFKVPLEAQFDFIIQVEEKAQVYQFSEPVFVQTNHVKEGEIVHINQSLMTITSPEITRFITEYHQAQKNLEVFEQKHPDLILKTSQILTAQNGVNAEKITQLTHQKENLEDIRDEELKRLKIHLQDTEYEINIDKKASQSKTISEEELRTAEKHFLDAKNRLENEQELYNTQITALENQIRELRTDLSLVKYFEKCTFLQLLGS